MRRRPRSGQDLVEYAMILVALSLFLLISVKSIRDGLAQIYMSLARGVETMSGDTGGGAGAARAQVEPVKQ